MADSQINQSMLSLSIRDISILNAYYMPFIKQGGLFVPTQRSHRLGDEVIVLLHLMDEPERTPVVGRVVMLVPKQLDTLRPRGIVIQFDAVEGQAVRQHIEDYLTRLNASIQPSLAF